MAENYNNMALTLSILSLLAVVLLAGFVYLDDSSVDTDLLEKMIAENERATDSNARAIVTLSDGTQTSINELSLRISDVQFGTIERLNSNQYFDGDYDNEIRDLEDVWDCLEDFAVDEDFNDLEDCLDDI